MATLRERNGLIYIDFRYKGHRYKERTNAPYTAQNCKKAASIIKKMEAEITLGTFEYLNYFPEGKSALKFAKQQSKQETGLLIPQSIKVFAEVWFAEKQVEWRQSHKGTVRISLDKHILPYFDDRMLHEIDKSQIMQFRAHLATPPGQSEGMMSASRVNHIMTPLRMIMSEASERFKFQNPWQNIKPLKEPRTNIDPFSLQEVQLILENVRADFRTYYTIRFFTGLRSGEVDACNGNISTLNANKSL